MKKLLMLLIVLALSLPAYAQTQDILVYKTTMTGSRFGEDGIKKAKVRGYLVLVVDANEISNLPNGSLSWPQVYQILYVKDGRKKWRYASEGNGWAWYYQPSNKKGKMVFDTEYSYQGGGMEAIVYGRVRRILIGTGKPKPRIPTKLKGHVLVWGGRWMGSGRQTVKLDSKRTKNANRKDKTIEQVVQALENRLEAKGYELPPPEN